MANWDNPTLSSLYADFLSELKARDSDLAKMFDAGTPTNVETDTIRWNSSANRFEKWDGGAWVTLVAKYAINVEEVDGRSYTDFAADPGGNGIIVRTAAGSALARSIVGGVAIGLTNGSGVSGNPSIRVILGAGDRILGRVSGGGDAQEITMTAAGRALVDDANATAQRTTLGLGSAALKNVGTSGDAVPLLNTANTWSVLQSFTGSKIKFLTSGEGLLFGTGGNDTFLGDIDFPDVSSADATFRLFRDTNTSGVCAFDIYDGDGSSSRSARFIGGGGLQIGTPTGGDKGAGTINAAGGAYDNGVRLVSGFTLGTEQSTSSGSSVTFGSIPAGTTEIVIEFEGVSLTSSADLDITIGDAGGLETGGYVSTGFSVVGVGLASSNSTAEFIVKNDNAMRAFTGTMTLTLKDSSNNTWMSVHTMRTADDLIHWGAGSKSLSAELTQVSISGGTFDGGSINIMYQ